MSDAVCGPSNPLQQFKQQAQRDRTLQQDRISSRASPSHGFRSADPNAGLLDPEFEAFQAGLPVADLPQYRNHVPPQQQFAAGPSWASDFQRLQISPPPAQAQRMHSPALNNWASDFRSQFAPSPLNSQLHTPPPQHFQQQLRSGLSGFQSNFAQQPSFAPNLQSKGKAPVVEQFDDAAFERAFEQAKDNMMSEDQIYHERANISHETLAQSDILQDGRMPGVDVLDEHPFPEELARQLNEPLPETEHARMDTEEQQQKPPTDDDALAATADELLHKIEHNQTDKFKNSQFLGLMRKLRDREVKVEGDQMVETVSASQPDSAYASGPATPDLAEQEQAMPTVAKEPASISPWFTFESSDFDHWESPMR